MLLDVDDPNSIPLRQEYDLMQRSRYKLLSPDGEVVRTWIGYLDEAIVGDAIGDYLDTLNN